MALGMYRHPFTHSSRSETVWSAWMDGGRGEREVEMGNGELIWATNGLCLQR